MLQLPANTRRPRSGRLYGWRLPAAGRLPHEPNQGCSQDKLEYLYVRYLLACVRPTGSPRLRSGLVCGPSTTETLWKRVPLSHVLHRRHKTISASSLDPRLAPLCTAPTHEHSYYVNWALDRGISATTPAIIRGVEPMPDRRCPGNPRQGPGGLQGSLLCFHIICKEWEDQNKRKARATSPEVFCLLPGYLAVWLFAPPPPSIRPVPGRRLTPSRSTGTYRALAYLSSRLTDASLVVTGPSIRRTIAG